ncbi:hypothetical protein GW17_00061042 [Ensete ventricosum]|nr:hypothetical protein GW17_00061042 [Ensete ventricosum]
MPRWLEGASEREEPAAARLASGGRSKGGSGRQQQARAAVAVEEEPHVGLWVQCRSATATTGNRLAAAEVAGWRGVAVALDDGSLLMAAKGSRSGLGEHGRRSREVDLCSRSLRGGGAATISGDVLTVEIEQRGRE